MRISLLVCDAVYLGRKLSVRYALHIAFYQSMRRYIIVQYKTLVFV